jgi:hypothetical protein
MGRPHRLSRRQTCSKRYFGIRSAYESNGGARVRALGGLGAVGIQLAIDAITGG